jgi:hypothetical protein
MQQPQLYHAHPITQALPHSCCRMRSLVLFHHRYPKTYILFAHIPPKSSIIPGLKKISDCQNREPLLYSCHASTGGRVGKRSINSQHELLLLIHVTNYQLPNGLIKVLAASGALPLGRHRTKYPSMQAIECHYVPTTCTTICGSQCLSLRRHKKAPRPQTDQKIASLMQFCGHGVQGLPGRSLVTSIRRNTLLAYPPVWAGRSLIQTDT